MKRILSIILILSFMFSLCAFNANAETHWAQSISEELVKIGIVSGDESGDLKLDNNITRAEFVKVINKAFGYTNKADSNFPDVSEDKWYYNEFLIAKLQGVITGDELGNANPEAVITRNEAAVILARALKLDTTDSSTQIKDIDLIPDWAKGAVIALNNKGIINGYSDGEFKGDNTLKRGEGFSLIGNIIKQSEKEEPENKENDPITAPPSTVNTNVSFGGGGGGGSSSGGGSGITQQLPKVAETPLLKFNASNGYLLSWNNCYGTDYYIVKIKIAGETPIEIPHSLNSIELFSYFADYASLRDNASEDFLVSVKSVGLPGYADDNSCSTELKIKVDFESIKSPVVAARYGTAGGVGRAIVTWKDVPYATDYNVTLLVNGVEKQDGFIIDKSKKEVLIPNTSFITDDTVLSIVAVSNDSMYKNSAPTVKKLVIEKEETVEQDGSEEKPWLISTADEFYKIGAEGSKYLKNDHYVITNDFVVTKPLIMADGKGFEGSIKGSLNGSDFKPTITLNIGSENAPYKDPYAGFVSDLKGSVSNLNFEGSIYAESDCVGAVCGNLTGTVIECVNNALISNKKNKTGGIAGSTSSATVSNCVNNGVISGFQYVAGIAGYTASTKINGCYNTASGKITATNTHAAGISGYAQGAGSSISRCANYGHIITVSGYTSGILAAVMDKNPITVSETFNAGIIQGSEPNLGSIIALARNGDSSKQTIDCTISDCFNVWLDDVNNKSFGLVGYIKYKTKVTDGTTDVGFERIYSTNNLPLYGKNEVYIEDPIEAINYITVDDCYYVGAEDSDRVDTALQDSDALKSLLTDYPAFNSENLWFVSDGSDGYNYPQLVNNPYKKEIVSIPEITNVTAKKVDEKLKFSWELPQNVSAVSVKVVNNTRIETVTDGYVELSDDFKSYTLDSFTDDSYYEIFVKMEFNDGSEFTDNAEIKVNSDN